MKNKSPSPTPDLFLKSVMSAGGAGSPSVLDKFKHNFGLGEGLISLISFSFFGGGAVCNIQICFLIIANNF